MIRKIHLDFHTQGEVEGIGAAFDPEAFADILTRSHVNGLVTPGKCQYGYTYFDTSVGTPHPHLARPDLFPATVAACATRGITVQAYCTLGLDEVTAVRHDDWRQRFRDGRCARWGASHLCFASPYVDEVVIPGVREMIARCPGLRGFWFDICLYLSGAFYSPWFDAAARERLGAGADDEARRWRLARQIVREQCLRLDAAVKTDLPDARNYFNSLAVPGEPENLDVQPYHEVENPVLFHGPEHMTAEARWLRRDGRQVIGLVSRFQGPWMDPGTVRTVDQMRFDAARTTALGCHVSMGDHRHPDGTLDPEVYRRVGAVYRELEAVEPWIEGMRPLREAALLTEIERGAPHLMPTLPALTLHAARLLEEAGLQFDLYSVDDELPEVPLVVWPGERPATPELLKRLEQHVKRGGALLATEAALEPAADGSVSADRLARLFGVRAMSPISPPGGGSPGALSAHGHVTAGSDAAGLAGQFLLPRRGLVERPFAQVMTGPVRLLRALPGTQVLADRLPAVSTAPPCPGRRRVGAVVVQRRRVIYSAAPLFREAMESGAPDPAGLIAALCRRLLPRRLVRHTGGPTVAAHLHRGVGGYALHLVHWAMDRWDAKKNPPTAFPLLAPVQVEIAVRERVRGVRLRPGGRRLAFRQRGGTCRFTVPAWRVWQVVSVRTC